MRDYSNNVGYCTGIVTVLPFGGSQNNLVINEPEIVPELEELETELSLYTNQQPTAAPNSTIAATDLAVQLFPNPAKDGASLVFELPADQSVQLMVFDWKGSTVISQQVDGIKGQNLIPLQAGQWPSGMYMVYLRTNGIQVQRRLVVQRD